MKCIDIINEIKGFAAAEPDAEKTCDTVKAGDAEKECGAVAVSMFATPEVIKKAAAIGAGLLIVHEPTYYYHMDNECDAFIAGRKKKLIEETGIVIFRFHDYAHMMKPDIVYDGGIKALGLEGKREEGGHFGINHFVLEEPMTARELAAVVKEKFGLNNVRLAGEPDKKGSRISCCFGTPGHVDTELAENDFVLAGEICEWREGEMAKDYAELGYNKAIIVLGHIGSEREGMKLLSAKLAALHPEMKVEYIECGELYN